MIRNALFASLIALGVAGAAQAQAPAPGGIVGGGSAMIAGGGEDQVITYSTGGAGVGAALRAQAPRLARARNGLGSGGLSVEYLEPETARPGREARLVGGGDDAQVVYSPTR
jgi:hypothetical protein